MNVIDRVESAKHAITGDGIGRAVSKATSHEVIGPKRKHVDYIMHALQASNISIPDVADMLFERCTNSSWIVVFKTLVTFHHLMANGNERFMQYIASKSTTWTLQTFTDKGGMQGYDMSHAIRKYSAYLADKAYAYRQMGYDFCRVTRGKDNGILRNMDTHKLLKALPEIQTLLDSLVATDIKSNDLTNGVITSAFMLLFKDLIRMFACYNDGIINLLEKYFDMKKAECKTSLEIYKRFLARMDRVSEFLKTAEDAGIDKGDIPDLTHAPGSLLEALDAHYQSLEKGKTITPPSKPLTLASFNVSSSTQNGFSSTQQSTKTTQEDYLQEQKRMLEMFEKKKRDEEVTKQRIIEQRNVVPNALSPPASKQHPPSSSNSFVAQHQQMAPPQSSSKASDDLLMLSGTTSQPMLSTQSNQSMFGQQTNMFSSDFNTPSSGSMNADFDNAFGNNFSAQSSAPTSATGNLLDDLLTPERPNDSNSQQTQQNKDEGRMSGDLNKGLERMAKSLDGLNINPNTMTANTQRGHNWNPQQQTKMTGGPNYQMQGMMSTMNSGTTMTMSMQQPGMMQTGYPMMGNNMMFNQQRPPFGMQSNMHMQQPFNGMQRPQMYNYGMMQPGMQMNQGMYQQNMGMNMNMQTRPTMMSNSSSMMNNDPFK